MTIERQWIEIMKMEVPEAFTDEMPFEAEVGFIDAQIKLMAMPHEATWEVFLAKQFLLPVNQMFASGARTVILAFDDYQYVPRAKAITQAKRRAHLVPYDFTENQDIPEAPPLPWDAAMANRAFKAKVVAFIIEKLPMLLYDIPRGKELIIDWRGPTLQHWVQEQGGLRLTEEPRMQEGEADLKFLKWCRLLSVPIAAEAIDGDFVPIAMASGCEHVAVQRYRIGGGHAMEWVDAGLLREGMRRAIAGRPGVLVQWDGWELHCLLALIAMTGTDYSRGIPNVGPKKVWGMLNHLLPVLTKECFRTEEGKPFMLPEVTARLIFAAIYTNAYRTHVRNGSQNFASVMAVLSASRLSQRTKASLPSLQRAICTVKNANFILDYWTGQDPNSMDPGFGFREHDGVVEWAD